MNVVTGSWVARLIGAVEELEPQDCADVDVAAVGVRGLCVECRMSFRMRRLGMSAQQAKLEALRDEQERISAEALENRFPYSLRKAIRQVADLEIEAQEGYRQLEEFGRESLVAFADGVRPVTETLALLLKLYKSVTGFEYKATSVVGMEIYELERSMR